MLASAASSSRDPLRSRCCSAPLDPSWHNSVSPMPWLTQFWNCTARLDLPPSSTTTAFLAQFDPPPPFCPPGSLNAVIDATLNPGAYTAIVRGKNNTTGVALVEVYDLNQAVDSKLANISTRAFVGTADDIVIAGFILGGNSGDTRIVVRGIGPSLAGFGVPNALANPTLELRDNNGALLIANNDWQDNPATGECRADRCWSGADEQSGVRHRGDAAAGPLHRAASGAQRRHRRRRGRSLRTRGAVAREARTSRLRLSMTTHEAKDRLTRPSASF